MFDPNKFLDTLILQLRSLGVDMTPINPPYPNSIELQPKNPKTCYKVTCYGHTPSFDGLSQLPYSLTAYAYPETKEFFISGNGHCPYYNDFCHYLHQGLTPAEAILKEHGLIDYDMKSWSVVIE